MRILSMPRFIWMSLAVLLLGHGSPSGAATTGAPSGSAGACKDIQEDMTSGQECLVRPGTLQSVYRDIVEHRLVRDAGCLLKALPGADTSVKGCGSGSGLRRIKYVVTATAVEIEMEYAGGITTIELERKAGGVRRKITYSAD